MADVGVLLESINVLFESIRWSMTSLSEKAGSTRFSSAEESLVVILIYGWHAGSLFKLHLKAVHVVTRYSITRKIF